jgi:hypothetical protein
VTQDQIATYRAALREARISFAKSTIRLGEIALEEYELKQETDRLRRTITALAAMCSEDPAIDRLGITDSCLEVMQVRKTTVTTADVVRSLELRGFDFSSQKNAPASVHAILSRLARKGTIQKVEVDENVVAWRGPNYDPEVQYDDEDVPF